MTSPRHLDDRDSAPRLPPYLRAGRGDADEPAASPQPGPDLPAAWPPSGIPSTVGSGSWPTVAPPSYVSGSWPTVGRDPATPAPAIPAPTPATLASAIPAAATPAPAADPERPPTGLRPFVLTGGRVGDDALEIDLETQVTTNQRAGYGSSTALAGLAAELRAIVSLCVEPMSVAEISARLRLHLGVTKVLVSDLHAAGHIQVHTSDPANPYSPDIILRVIRGLRAIS